MRNRAHSPGKATAGNVFLIACLKRVLVAVRAAVATSGISVREARFPLRWRPLIEARTRV
jgi:hypothetical protein